MISLGRYLSVEGRYKIHSSVKRLEIWPAQLQRQVWWMTMLIFFSLCLHTSGQLGRRGGARPMCSMPNPWQFGVGGQGTPPTRPVLTKQGFLALKLQQEPREWSHSLLAKGCWLGHCGQDHEHGQAPVISIAFTTTCQKWQDLLACSSGTSFWGTWGTVWFFSVREVTDLRCGSRLVVSYPSRCMCQWWLHSVFVCLQTHGCFPNHSVLSESFRKHFKIWMYF